MKKHLIIAALAVGTAASAFAQGTVYFSNSGGTKVSVNTVAGGAATGLANATAGSYYYALFATTSATSIAGVGTGAVIPSATSVGTYVFSDPKWSWEAYGSANGSAGRFVSSSADASSATALPSIAGGTAATYYVVLGWSSSIGSTVASLESYLAAPYAGGYVGESAVGGPTPAGIPGSTAPATLFGSGAPYISGFTLGVVPVPEPTSIALAVMGGASLLALRRKKA
jgi:hypothetical protein